MVINQKHIKLFSLAVIAGLLLFVTSVKADDVSFTLNAPKVVAVGEQFQITYTLNSNATSINPGNLGGFRIVGGPYTSQSSSIQIINGNMTKSETYTYTYAIQAQSEGKFTIGPGIVKVKRDEYKSNAVAIEVVKGNTSAQTQSPQAGQQQRTTTQQQSGSGDDLYIKVLLNKSNVYVGEQIIATIKIYTKQNISSLDKFELPSFAGFYKEDIETPPLRNLERENINGEIFYTGVLYRAALIPQKNGEIRIDPAKLEVITQQRVNTGRPRSVFDDFFGSSYRNIRHPLASKPVVVFAKPLPSSKPSGFTGAVGKFNISSTLSPQNVKTNDAITYRIKISGSGNIKLLANPKLNLQPSLETYDPKINKNIKTTISGTSGDVVYEYLIIPRYAGEFEIPSLTFSYFDLATKSYKSLSTQSYTINVEKGNDSSTTTVVSGLSKEELQYVGKDIRYIKTNKPKFKQKGFYYIKQTGFYLVYIIALFVFVAIVAFTRKIQKRNKDVALIKNRKARNVALKRLKLAHTYVREDKASDFYNEILKAVWGYISDKLTIPVSELSQDKAIDILNSKGISEATVDNFKKVIDIAELAKYAPSAVEYSLAEVYETTVELIISIEGETKNNGSKGLS